MLLSKSWPDDSGQFLALRRAGVAEIRHSTLSAPRKAALEAYLWRRIYGRRLPPSVKHLAQRWGL